MNSCFPLFYCKLSKAKIIFYVQNNSWVKWRSKFIWIHDNRFHRDINAFDCEKLIVSRISFKTPTDFLYVCCRNSILNYHSIEDGKRWKMYLTLTINPYHAEFLKWNNPSYNFGTVHHQFYGFQDENLKMVCQQYRAWSDCTDVQAGLALYWWQRLITFDVGRIRVKRLGT